MTRVGKFVLVYRHTSSQFEPTVLKHRNNIFEPYRSVARESKYTRIERRANYRNEARVVASERTLGATAHEGGGLVSKAIIELAVLDVGRPALAAVFARAAAQRVLEELVPDVGHAGQAPVRTVAHTRPELPIPPRVRVRS